MQEIIERLNDDVSNKEFQKLIYSLHQNGCRFTNMWDVINSFETHDEFKRRISYNVRHNLIEESLKLAKKILRVRQLKKDAISNLKYGEAKLHFEKEFKLKVKLMKQMREGSLKTYHLLNDYVVDVFEPSLIKLE